MSSRRSVDSGARGAKGCVTIVFSLAGSMPRREPGGYHSRRVQDAAFLFDVDGTLLQAGNQVHNESLKAAVEIVCGKPPDTRYIHLAGRTDTEILGEMVTSAGLDMRAELLPQLFAAAVAEF